MARLTLQYNGPGTAITLLSVPSLRTPTAIGLHEGRVVVHFTMTVEDGLITRGAVVLDRTKLADLNLALVHERSTPTGEIDRRGGAVTRYELLAMLHVLGVIAWVGGGLALLVLHAVAVRAHDYDGLATAVCQSRLLGACCTRLPHWSPP